MPGLSTSDVKGVAERKKKRICPNFGEILDKLVMCMGCALNVATKWQEMAIIIGLDKWARKLNLYKILLLWNHYFRQRNINRLLFFRF